MHFQYLIIGTVVVRSFNSISNDARIESVLLAVLQIAAFKDNLSKHCLVNRYKSINISKITYFGKVFGHFFVVEIFEIVCFNYKIFFIYVEFKILIINFCQGSSSSSFVASIH